MRRDFHTLTVAETRKEIDGAARSVTFDVPPELTELFEWQAGQHLTVRLSINGEEHRRSYTISNPPGSRLRITVKRVKGGAVSNHIGDSLSPGDETDVMPPFGRFTLTPGPLERRTHYFFGAGSGITPLYSMINAVLKDEPHSAAHLVYGNAAAGSIIFKAELDELQEQYPERFSVRHILSDPSMWSRFTPWKKGRVDAAVLREVLSATPPVAQDAQYWICGPGSMNHDVKAALMELDVPAGRIHMESFGGTTESDTSEPGMAARARIVLNGSIDDIPVAADQTILDAARAAGLRPPYSCQSGVCGACVARLSEGSVHMRSRMALEDGDIAKGLILTCQSVASDRRVAVKFEG